MYYFIKGKYITRGENYCVIENNNIGYKIYSSEATIAEISKTSGDVMIYTYLHVREDVMDLYGFLTNEELSVFLKLLSVSGVGTKVALAILSITTPEGFALAVITEDVAQITNAAGVGPKLAKRVILELKDRMKTEDAINVNNISKESFVDVKAEAVSALVVLGYSQTEAKNAVSSLEGESVEDLVKEALKKLMR